MTPRLCRFIVLAALVVPAAIHVLAQDAQPPRFRAGVELQPIDVSVIDNQGRPVLDLGPDDFKVFIDGVPRRVANAEWVTLTGKDSPPDKKVAVPEGYSANARIAGGRLIVIAVDQPNIHFGGWLRLRETIERFIDRLLPSDRVAVVGFGAGAATTGFTTDREVLKATLRQLNGRRQEVRTAHDLGASEAIAIAKGDGQTLEAIVRRDCRGQLREQDLYVVERCKDQIINEAESVATVVDAERDTTIHELLNVLSSLETFDAPKTVVLVSEGISLSEADREAASRLIELGARAAEARATVYALRLEENISDVSRRRAPVGGFEDRRVRSQGLGLLTAAARGEMFNVTGTGEGIVDRIERELTGYYLLGVDADPGDASRGARSLRVEVARPGVTVRARRMVVRPRAASDARLLSPRESISAALTTPIPMTGLPLQAISFNLQGPEAGRVQLLIHVNIGTDYTSAQSVSVAYMIRDRQGRIIESQSTSARLVPQVMGMPSALAFQTGASLPPGEYTLKLAAVEGTKVGSIEHPIHASLNEAGALKISDLIVGGPIPTGDPTARPTVDHLVRFGVVQAYLEAYGTAPNLKVRYEIAADDKGSALVGADAVGRPVGESRSQFAMLIPTSHLPPGKYRLRAAVSAGGAHVATLVRPFEIPELAGSSTSPDRPRDGPLGSAGSSGDLFLPVAAGDLANPFQLSDALHAETLQQFETRVPPTVKQPFDVGLGHLRSGDYPAAERSFKEALRADGDTTGPLVYLAVCFAAAGHDFEASSAWQTALARASDLPQIYYWLSEALLRAHEMARAQSILEEAIRRWPDDSRFTKPLAMLYATFGRGDEAFRLHERYIAAGHTDADTMYRALEWIVRVHSSGRVVYTPAEDVALARSYADTYAKLNGPKRALVREWVSYLERAQR